MLSNSKQISLNNRFGISTTCNRSGCKNCKLMSNSTRIDTKQGSKFMTAQGDCTSKNIIYAAVCQICSDIYVGRSTQMLASRNNGHRAKFIRYSKMISDGTTLDPSELDDEYTLGIHLHTTHKLTDKHGFDNFYKFTILEVCNPRDIARKEHLWIHKLRTLHPQGLNLCSTFGLPLLFHH